MEIRKDDLVFSDQFVLGGQRLLDLDNHVSLGIDLTRRVHQLAARVRVILIAEPASYARATFDEDSVFILDQFLCFQSSFGLDGGRHKMSPASRIMEFGISIYLSLIYLSFFKFTCI